MIPVNNQKTYQALRQECRALRAAHKKIKEERDALVAQHGETVYGSSGDGEPITWYVDHPGMRHNLKITHTGIIVGVTPVLEDP